ARTGRGRRAGAHRRRQAHPRPHRAGGVNVESRPLADVKVLAGGLDFPEGPVAMADGSVLLTEIDAATVTRVAPDGSTEVVARCEGGPNGAALGPDGALYVCNNGGRFASGTWTGGWI